MRTNWIPAFAGMTTGKHKVAFAEADLVIQCQTK
jgi:hypothetical protein